jgi:hypothetical protein
MSARCFPILANVLVQLLMTGFDINKIRAEYQNLSKLKVYRSAWWSSPFK